MGVILNMIYDAFYDITNKWDSLQNCVLQI